MKIKNYKCKCGNDDFFFGKKGYNMGIYCSYCGKFLKWADKDERNLSMKQEHKTGKWIVIQKGLIVTTYECSKCKRQVIDDTGYDVRKDYPFCHCGADMRGEDCQ